MAREAYLGGAGADCTWPKGALFRAKTCASGDGGNSSTSGSDMKGQSREERVKRRVGEGGKSRECELDWDAEGIEEAGLFALRLGHSGRRDQLAPAPRSITNQRAPHTPDRVTP